MKKRDLTELTDEGLLEGVGDKILSHLKIKYPNFKLIGFTTSSNYQIKRRPSILSSFNPLQDKIIIYQNESGYFIEVEDVIMMNEIKSITDRIYQQTGKVFYLVTST